MKIRNNLYKYKLQFVQTYWYVVADSFSDAENKIYNFYKNNERFKNYDIDELILVEHNIIT